jgi:hypothetical protein
MEQLEETVNPFLVMGCGCIYLVVDMRGNKPNANTVARLIDYCGDSEGLTIGKLTTLGEAVMPVNVDVARPVEHTTSTALLDKLGELVADGYRFRDLQNVLKRVVAS